MACELCRARPGALTVAAVVLFRVTGPSGCLCGGGVSLRGDAYQCCRVRVRGDCPARWRRVCMRGTALLCLDATYVVSRRMPCRHHMFLSGMLHDPQSLFICRAASCYGPAIFSNRARRTELVLQELGPVVMRPTCKLLERLIVRAARCKGTSRSWGSPRVSAGIAPLQNGPGTCVL